MAVAGSLTYDTKIDKNGFEKGLNSLKNSTNTVGGQIKSIVAALGIDKLISATFNLLNNSLDGAISRLDTLNNYPKVMSNLGIASEDAQKSIAKMSDKLSGLPTTLDEGALAVQRFTSKNNDVAKSTDYFLALNNALLAGGAGADIQTSALEQLSQAYSKGKPDMMEWRTLQMAMPAQLNQIAKSLGLTTEQLGAGLRGAKKDVSYLRDVTMEEFMEAITKLNTEGAEGFASFEEQARNSTGGIATSIIVAKTQIIKGVTDIISKIDEGLKNAGVGGISEIIANIGKKAKEILDLVAEKIPDFIEKVKQIIPIIQKLIPLIIAVTTATLTFKMALAIQNTVTNAIQSLKILFLVMMANPIVLIISLIAGLVAGFIYLWNTSENFRNFWINLWENIKLIFITIWDAIKTFITQTIPNWFNSLVDTIKNIIIHLPYYIGFIIGEIIGKVIQFGVDLWGLVTTTIPETINFIVNWFKQLPNRVWTWLQNTINNVVNFGRDMAQRGKEGAVNLFNNIVNTIKNLPNNMLNIGKNIVQGLWNGIKNAGSWIKNKVKEFARGILDGMKSALGIHSPSTLFENEVGKFIPQGVAVGVEADTDKALKAIDNMNNDIMSEMNKAVAFETGSINANASVKSNNSMLNVIKATFNIDGSVDIDGQKAGRILTPYMTKNLRTAGVY